MAVERQEFFTQKIEKIVTTEIVEELKGNLKVAESFIKFAFQRIDHTSQQDFPALKRGVIRYTPLFYVNSLTPKGEELYKSLNVTPQVFLKLLVVEGFVKALNKKSEIFTNPSLNLSTGNSKSFQKYRGALDAGKVPDEFIDKIKILSSDLSLSLNLPVPSSNFCWSKFILNIWNTYNYLIDEITKQNMKIGELVKNFLIKIPQQSLRTGFTPQIYEKAKNNSEYYEFVDDYITYLKKIKFYDNFINEIIKNNPNPPDKLEDIITEWIYYNILTNIEFYIHGGYNLGNSIMIMYPVLRVKRSEPFGLFYLFINKSESFTLLKKEKIHKILYPLVKQFTPLKKEKIHKILYPLVKQYTDKFDMLLIDEFMEDVKAKALNELLEKGIKIENFTHKIETIFRKTHNEKLLICNERCNICSSGCQETCPQKADFPYPKGLKVALQVEWEFRWGQLYNEFLSYAKNLKKIQEEILRNAISATIAEILNRVISHDIGHVLTNAILPENSMENDKYFKHLTSFLQTRMVFIAEVSTVKPSLVISLPFVSQIVHPFIYYIVDSEKKISPVGRHLAETEGVKEIKVIVYHKTKSSFNTLEFKIENNFWQCVPYDLHISIPSGLVGAHAFYCIFENVIRNGAKYGKNKKESLNLYLRLDSEGFEHDEEFIRVRIWDDHSIYDPEQFQRICQFFPPNYLDYLAKPQEDKGLWRFISEKGKIISGGFGVKEMRIAAAWLRKEYLSEILLEENNLKIPLLRPIVVDGEGNEGNLVTPPSPNNYMGYEFYVLKPKELLIVADDIEINNNIKNQLRMRGIDFSSDLESLPQKGIDYYACIIKIKNKKEDKIERDVFPSRLILISNKETDKKSGTILWSEESYNELINEFKNGKLSDKFFEAYQKWVEEILEPPTQGINLLINLKSSPKAEAPTTVVKKWQEILKRFNDMFRDKKWQMFLYGYDDKNFGKNFTGQNYVVFDYHKVWWGEEGKGDGDYYFYEPCYKNHATQIVLFNPPSETWVGLKLVFGLIEAGITNIGIADERIWLKRNKKVPDESLSSLSEVLKQRRIFLPPFSDDFYKKPKLYKEHFEKFLKDNKIKILLIHQGILDKMFEKKEEIEEWIDEIKKITPFVIVESDRGESFLPNLPKNARFISFSAFEPLVSESGPSKYQLVQTLLSATKPEVL